MSLLAAVALAAGFAAGCKATFADYCEQHADCDNPERPFCDVNGDYPASEGHGRVCIGEPFDGSVPPRADAAVHVDGSSQVDAAVGAPPTPAVMVPAAGAFTGSVYASGNLRPLFRWHRSQEASYYELQVDGDCPVFGFAGCGFPSPELDVSDLAETAYRAEAALPVSMEAPVGARYYWRVRGCNDLGCSLWSPARQLNVGRQLNDYNGDGFSDRAVAGGAQAGLTGAVYLIFGKPSWTVPSTVEQAGSTLADPRAESGGQFGSAVSAVGDVNGDGYADLVVGASRHDLFGTDAGAAYLYLGKKSWPVSVAAANAVLAHPQAENQANFGLAISGGGDIDGDGFSDFLVGAPAVDGASMSGAAYGYLGRPNWPPNISDADLMLRDPTDQQAGAYGAAVACRGDLSGDGLADMVVGAPNASNPEQGEGVVYLYFGKEDFGSLPAALSSADTVMDNPLDEQGGRYGASLASGGDVNGDGYGDLAIGAPGQSEPESREGNAYLQLGRADWASQVSNAGVRVDHPSDVAEATMATSLALGDTTGDGLADLLVGAPTPAAAGQAFLFVGRGTWPSEVIVADVQFDNPSDEAGSEFGRVVTLSGDINGDGRADVSVGAAVSSPELHEGAVFMWLGRGTWPAELSTSEVSLDNPIDFAGARFGSAVD